MFGAYWGPFLAAGLFVWRWLEAMPSATECPFANMTAGPFHAQGPGLVGAAVMKQLVNQAPKLQQILNASIKVVGVANSRQMFVNSADGAALHDNWRDQLQQGEPVDLQAFGDQLIQAARVSNAAGHRASTCPCAVIVDCTASEAGPSMYVRWMRAGLHIVTPNKRFGAGDLQRYKELRQLSWSQGGRQFLYEATVGAGLPVLSTLRSLIETGDQVLRVEGILSGTLSYIFNTWKPGMTFSEVVADAKAKGYTEPDPREDLSGMDVARKVIILARECGLDVSLDDLHVDSLVPEPLAQPGVSVEQYMQRLPEFDAEMAHRANAADAAGEVIRYVGCVDVTTRKASVSMVSYAKDHPFALLSGSDNQLVFTTQRYKQQPLIIRGPGAGAEVTAAGVVTDIIQAIRCHGNAC